MFYCILLRSSLKQCEFFHDPLGQWICLRVLLWYSLSLFFIWCLKVSLPHPRSPHPTPHLLLVNKIVVFIDLWNTISHAFLHLFKTTRNEKWPLKIKWIALDLLMKKPIQWFKTKIMMIKIHRIQAG